MPSCSLLIDASPQLWILYGIKKSTVAECRIVSRTPFEGLGRIILAFRDFPKVNYSPGKIFFTILKNFISANYSSLRSVPNLAVRY